MAMFNTDQVRGHGCVVSLCVAWCRCVVCGVVVWCVVSLCVVWCRCVLRGVVVSLCVVVMGFILYVFVVSNFRNYQFFSINFETFYYLKIGKIYYFRNSSTLTLLPVDQGLRSLLHANGPAEENASLHEVGGEFLFFRFFVFLLFFFIFFFFFFFCLQLIIQVRSAR